MKKPRLQGRVLGVMCEMIKENYTGTWTDRWRCKTVVPKRRQGWRCGRESPQKGNRENAELLMSKSGTELGTQFYLDSISSPTTWRAHARAKHLTYLKSQLSRLQHR